MRHFITTLAFVSRHTGRADRADRTCIELEALRDEEPLGEIHGILDEDEQRQQIGRRITLVEEAASSKPMTIVGVVGNIRQRWLPSGEFDPVVYRSYAFGSPS